MENLERQILDEELDNAIDKPWAIAFKYGVIGGMIFIGIELIKYSFGMMDLEQITNPSSSSAVFNMVIGFVLSPLAWIIYTVLYFLAIRSYRNELGGFISFGKAFRMSFFSVLAKAAVIFVWGIVYYLLIIPNYCTDMLNFLEETIGQNIGTNNDVISMYSVVYNPFSLALASALSTIVGGALLSLLAAAIGKKSRMSN